MAKFEILIITHTGPTSPACMTDYTRYVILYLANYFYFLILMLSLGSAVDLCSIGGTSS